MLHMSANGLQSQQAARHDRQNAHAELAKYEKDLKTTGNITAPSFRYA